MAKEYRKNKEFWQQYFRTVRAAFGLKVAVRDTLREIKMAAKYDRSKESGGSEYG